MSPVATLDEVVETFAEGPGSRDRTIDALLALGLTGVDTSSAILVALNPTLGGFARKVAGAKGATEDEEADILAAAWTAIREEQSRPAPDARQLVQRAWDLTRSATRRRRSRAWREEPRSGAVVPAEASPPDPLPHGAELLRLALSSKVVSRSDAELIVRTRVGGVTLADLSRSTGIPASTLGARRAAAERALRWVQR